MPKHRSTGLWSYLTGLEASEHRADKIEWQSATRPPGELVWLHVVDPARLLAATQLARRLSQTRPGLSCVLTSSHGTWGEHHLINRLDESVSATEAFLDQCGPNLCIWIGGDLDSVTLRCAMTRKIDLLLVDPPAKTLHYGVFSLYRRRLRNILFRFSQIFVSDEDTAETLARLRFPVNRITTIGAFLEVGALLPANEAERDLLAPSLRARPVWLAARVQSSELDIVLNAHRAVMRFALRAILVLVPADLSELALFREKLSNGELRDQLFSTGEPPSETTQVLLVDEDMEMGLWYRLAPIVFLGSSLSKGMSGQDPNTPAAHGLALLCGPYRGVYTAACQRYAEAEALLTVHNKLELSEAVKRLLAPDQAALMARRAWDIGSRGAAMMDAIVDAAHDQLDRAGGN